MPNDGHRPETRLLYIQRLVQAGSLLIWDPVSKELMDENDIEGVCLNGDAVQISLREDRSRAEDYSDIGDDSGMDHSSARGR